MTDFLVALPSVLSGIARTLDLGGRFDAYNASEDVKAADSLAMYADFQVVGEDLWRSFKAFEASPEFRERVSRS